MLLCSVGKENRTRLALWLWEPGKIWPVVEKEKMGVGGSHLVRTWEKNVGSLGTKSDAAQEGSVGGCRLEQV